MKKENRIIKGSDFKRVYSARKSSYSQNLTISYAPNGLSVPRLGLSVSTKVGSAVIRNRIKRVFRAAFHDLKESLKPGYDFVIIPKAGYIDGGLEVAKQKLADANKGLK